MGVTWLDLPLGLACLLVGLHQFALLVTRRAPAAGAAAHAAMGLGMAAMFVPAADPVPQPVWVAVFLVLGAWFVAAAVGEHSFGGEPAQHVMGAAAMLFMLLGGHHHGATAPGGAVDPEHAQHAGAAGGAPQLLVTAAALALAAWFAADVVRLLIRRPAPVGARVGAGTASAPETGGVDAASVPHLVMDVAMIVMLLGMA